MTHHHDQAPAPLTAEVVAMVAQLRTRLVMSMFASRSDLYTAQERQRTEAADMLTALATQLAERDAELARVTAERDSALAFEMLRISELEKLHPRIAALTEAASRVLHDIDDLVANSEGVTGLHQNGDVAEWADILEGGSFEAWLRSVETLRAALTADKGAAS